MGAAVQGDYYYLMRITRNLGKIKFLGFVKVFSLLKRNHQGISQELVPWYQDPFN